jgi:hypothetical protein
MMKSLLLTALLVIAATAAWAEIRYVNPYYRGDGTYVSGHYKDTSADGNPYNNRKALWGY